MFTPTTAFQFAEQSLVDFLKTREMFQAEPIEFVSVDNCCQVGPSYERALPDLTRNLQVPRELCVDYTTLSPSNESGIAIAVSSILDCRNAKSCCGLFVFPIDANERVRTISLTWFDGDNFKTFLFKTPNERSVNSCLMNLFIANIPKITYQGDFVSRLSTSFPIVTQINGVSRLNIDSSLTFPEIVVRYLDKSVSEVDISERTMAQYSLALVKVHVDPCHRKMDIPLPLKRVGLDGFHFLHRVKLNSKHRVHKHFRRQRHIKWDVNPIL